MPRIHVLDYAWPVAGGDKVIDVPLRRIDSDREKQIG
jgi:hypothetical protein